MLHESASQKTAPHLLDAGCVRLDSCSVGGNAPAGPDSVSLVSWSYGMLDRRTFALTVEGRAASLRHILMLESASGN